LGIPFALVSAITCGPRGLGIGLFLFVAYGLLATQAGFGPFAAHVQDPITSLFEMAAAALCLGVPGHFAGLTLKQLQRHRTELEETVAQRTRELQVSEERYRLAVDAVSEGVFDWQDGQARSFYNPSIRRRLGDAIPGDGVGWLRIW